MRRLISELSLILLLEEFGSFYFASQKWIKFTKSTEKADHFTEA